MEAAHVETSEPAARAYAAQLRAEAALQRAYAAKTPEEAAAAADDAYVASQEAAAAAAEAASEATIAGAAMNATSAIAASYATADAESFPPAYTHVDGHNSSPIIIIRTEVEVKSPETGGFTTIASPIVLLKNFGHDHGKSIMNMLPLDADDIEVAKETINQRIGGVGARFQLHPYWDSDIKRTVEALEDLAYSAFRKASHAVYNKTGSESCKEVFKECLMLPFQRFPVALLYVAPQILQDHVDSLGKFAVLISLGDTVEFTVAGHVFMFESGDVLLFDAGERHAVAHGVRRVLPGTAPSSLPPWLNGMRISITMRQGMQTSD